jgi:hypothetical protein
LGCHKGIPYVALLTKSLLFLVVYAVVVVGATLVVALILWVTFGMSQGHPLLKTGLIQFLLIIIFFITRFYKDVLGV